ncbi:MULTISPECIES: acetate/propionate family kinase [unclassified Sphingomonas]|jgi:acetate kinase|uniref:acetate/propionate family kinase n=1 Tax=unclassified Sphingomonas TaxID=196159 RepID=UPI00053EA127|nr:MULTISPECIES: acetate kinase [unclassified Sphingomonas]
MGAVSGKRVLTLNGGSSSVKYGLYAVGDAVVELSTGEVEHADVDAGVFADVGGGQPDAIGHRIVHGGIDLFAPVRIDADVLARLQAATAFAPLHGPASLRMIALAQARYPGVPQIACFDTGFHASLPAIAATLPIPKALRDAGVRRYGFHGLSCESILAQLGDAVPHRLIIAHLGNGASVTAVLGGQSVDTSMGLTPSGGVVMGTRAGDIDPGLLLYLMRERGLDAAEIETLIDRQSGLLGLSGRSSDLRVLHAAGDAAATLALAIFCRSVAKQMAGMLVVLGGADLIVFTGGIGEHDAAVRAAISADLAFAGPIAQRVLPSQENAQIARHVGRLLG